MRSLSILLCGYGWFAGIPEGETNNAERIARALDGEILARGDARAVVHGMTMPVLWNGAFEPVQAAIDELKPDLVLALGTDARASAMRPEPFGVNWRRGRDAGGNPEENAPILRASRIGCAARFLMKRWRARCSPPACPRRWAR